MRVGAGGSARSGMAELSGARRSLAFPHFPVSSSWERSTVTTASGQQNTSAAGDRLLLKPVGGTAQQDRLPTSCPGWPRCHPGGHPRGAREVEFGGSNPERWEVHLTHGPDQGACEPAAGSDRPGLCQAQVPGGTQPQDGSAVWVGAGRPSWQPHGVAWPEPSLLPKEASSPRGAPQSRH